VLPMQLDLRLPMSAHELRRRLRRDSRVGDRLRRIIQEQTGPAVPSGTLLITRDAYRELRHLVKHAADAELELVRQMQTWKITSPLTTERCTQVRAWAHRHESKLLQQANLFHQLGYSSVDILVRFGEEGFLQLADCLLPSGGFVITIDYGASFEALVHSSAVSGEDNVVPPMYEIPEGSTMPDCHSEWTRCAGLIDWTTFVDFSNLAAVGHELGWQPVFYGPQSALEQISDLELINPHGGERLMVPGYFTLHQAAYPKSESFLGRAVASWYGRTVDGGQRWASFKVLVQFKAPRPKQGSIHCQQEGGATDSCQSPLQSLINKGHVVLSPSYPMTNDDRDPCWSVDATQIPLADQMRLEQERGGQAWEALARVQYDDQVLQQLDKDYADAYEDLQLAVRLVDWLVATRGCHAIRSGNRSMLVTETRWPQWVRMWGRQRLHRVGMVVLRELRGLSTEPPTKHMLTTRRPFECAAHHSVRLLCQPAAPM